MRALDRWLIPYLRQKKRRVADGVRVFLTIADHFEPYHHTNHAGAMDRMKRWSDEYPVGIAPFRDSGGRTPRHTFFYPIEQYDPEVVGKLAEVCRSSGSETEVHLHHDGDTEESLREKLLLGVSQLQSHGMLSQDPSGKAAFAFVHGDWALANCHPSGEACGVPHELAALRECGCYADLTFPSAPSPTQPTRVNSMYYVEDTGSPRTLSHGPAVRAGIQPAEAASLKHLLLIQGVLALNWDRRKWGVLPRMENSDITSANPPVASRFHSWLKHAPSPAGLPSWVFIKLHTHGAVPRNSDVFLGEPMRRFHRYLCEEWAGRGGNHLHYVTAREMVNVLRAVEGGAREFHPALLDSVFPPPETSRVSAPAASSL
ncbi:MAG TPA: hypothetical protein VLE43_20620 [Candidatus Saccharimonadia bacterium]|nr:hypothetical protein [Candidatus Saccharimonadia bacterium]